MIKQTKKKKLEKNHDMIILEYIYINTKLN